MNHAQWQEEQDAFFSRNDRFDGFDRGDADFVEYDDDGNPAPAVKAGGFDDGSNDISF